MQIVATKVHEPTDIDPSFTVEFEGDGGERVSVVMAQSASGSLTRDNALGKAQVILLQASSFGSVQEGRPDARDDLAPGAEPSAAVESLIQEQEQRDDRGSDLQEGLEDTFPASDPVSTTYTSTAARDQQS
jgi:hypothetical protein